VRLAALVAGLVLALAPAAHAQDRFEIQVYDSETASTGETGLEVHTNVFAQGSVAVENGELPTDRVGHLTLEPHLGLASWCELGAYLQTAIRADSFDYAGVKLRWKARLPRRIKGVIGLALNLELSSVPPTYEASVLGGELRPIFDVSWKRLWFSVNPILSIDFLGPDAGLPQLQPAAALLVAVTHGLALGTEYYAGLGPINRPLPASEQTHRLFAVAQWERRWFAVNVGVGYGFVGPERWIVKSILSFNFNNAFP
jgi:hypothetical protein